MTKQQYQAWRSFDEECDEANDWCIGGVRSDSVSGPLESIPIALPTLSTEILRPGRDCSRLIISADRLVDAVAQVGDVLYLRIHATGPAYEPAVGGSSGNIRYQPRTVSIDIHDGFPAQVVTDELSTVVGWNWSASAFAQTTFETKADQHNDEDVWFERFEREFEADKAARQAWSERIDLEGVVWSAEDDKLHRQRSDYRGGKIVLEGTWPQDEAIVTFEHRKYPHVRLRNRVRAHDDSGRPLALTYLTVSWDEVLSTGQVPPLSAAVNRIIT
jgi:hypothetical protein